MHMMKTVETGHCTKHCKARLMGPGEGPNIMGGIGLARHASLYVDI